MDSVASRNLKNKLDYLVVEMTGMIKADIYENVIVNTVKDWFEGSESILELNDRIKTNVNSRWPFVELKVKNRLSEYENYSKSVIEGTISTGSNELDVKEISNSVSQSISVAVGALGTSIVAMISGGAGTALLATGPVGIIMGIMIGAFAWFIGKDELEKNISAYIADKKIPKLIKKSAKGKVSTQLKLNESKFEQDIFNSLKNQLEPVYRAIANVE
ncbi:MAG: hypothetical protein GYA14_02815 [Ignavibacteria bacterium]|nr:hypothetical protein [Ignavibacteria bacterium]